MDFVHCVQWHVVCDWFRYVRFRFCQLDFVLYCFYFTLLLRARVPDRAREGQGVGHLARRRQRAKQGSGATPAVGEEIDQDTSGDVAGLLGVLRPRVHHDLPHEYVSQLQL